MQAQVVYDHVKGHMDRYLLWHQLTLEQQLNCVCDGLAKTAVARCIRLGFQHRQAQLLPHEDAAVIVGGKKATSDFAKPIRFDLSKRFARWYLPSFEGWTTEQFDEVDWERLDATLEPKADMYKIWLSKQHTGFCGTRVQVAYYSGEKDQDGKPLGDLGCPNCGERETAAHLCVCPSEDRTRLLVELTEELERWMVSGGKTNPEIAYWVPKYILFRGTRNFADMGMMSPSMRALAESQDKIGWRNFMEGRISTHFASLQHYHLLFGTSHLNGDDWVRHFITKILHITHSQWIFRNFSLHDRQQGYLRRMERVEILKKIEELADRNPDEVPAESRFLLEFDMDQLVSKGSFEKKSYRVVAMEAARRAGSRKAQRGARQRRRDETRRFRLSRRVRLGIPEVERQIQREAEMLLHSRMNDITSQCEISQR